MLTVGTFSNAFLQDVLDTGIQAALLNPSDYLNRALSPKVLVTAAKFTADSGG